MQFPYFSGDLARVRLALVVAAFVVVGSVAGSDATAATPRERDAAAYAAAYGVTLAEAQRRLDLQVLAGQLDERLTATEPGTFAGLWIQHRPTYRVIVSFTRDASTTLARYVVGTPLQPEAEARAARYTLEKLRSELSALTWVGPAIPADLGISVQENLIDIGVESIERFQRFARSRGFTAPQTARVIVTGALARPAADIFGGLALDGNGCTSGFGVLHNGTPDRGITTAGHCGDSASYLGSSLPFQSQSLGGNHDEQWHLAPAFQVVNRIWDGTSGRDITSRTLYGSQAVGSFVCKYGRTTGFGCGDISQKDYIPSMCVPNARPTFVLVLSNGSTDLATEGDSGGPVFVGNSAYGQVTCWAGFSGLNMVYTAVDFIESGLGVTVLTSP